MIVRKHMKGFKWAVAILVILAFIALFPLLLVLLNSFKTHLEILKNPLTFPEKFHFENYAYSWKVGKFGEGFINSIKLSGTAIVIGVIASSGMGYVLATKRIKPWKALSFYFLLATTVPLQMFMLPLYSTFNKLGLIGNVYAVGLAIAAWDLPLPVFLMRTYFLKIPLELEESARIDGASTWQVLRHIVFPLASPGMVTVACIIGLFAWNEYLLSTTFLQSERNFTATLKFLGLNGTFSRDYSVIMSGAMIMVIPMVVIFLLLQKQFIEGITGGAVKG